MTDLICIIARQKGTPYKWLDLSGLFRDILQPHHNILKIKHFTARVNARHGDGSNPQRQDVYLRALESYCDSVEIYFGHFLTHQARVPLAKPQGNQKFVEVLRTEEKGSDVNLAVHLLNDGWKNVYDCAIVVTNDSDVAEAVRLTRQLPDLDIQLGLITPGTGNLSQQLLCHANFHRRIRKTALKNNQLPSPVPGTAYIKPENW